LGRWVRRGSERSEARRFLLNRQVVDRESRSRKSHEFSAQASDRRH
jgi:hypothetical protein